MVEMEVEAAVVVVVVIMVTRGPVADMVLSRVDVSVSCWAPERMDGLFIQEPILLGRQFEQGLPAFTQAHPLQMPVLLHLQHAMFT